MTVHGEILEMPGEGGVRTGEREDIPSIPFGRISRHATKRSRKMLD
jgi:hypothetical protein